MEFVLQWAAGELPGGEQSDGVGADGEERCVSEIEQAGEAYDDVEPNRQEDVDSGVRGRADQVIARAAGRHVGDAWPEKDPDDEQRIDRAIAVLEGPHGPAHGAIVPRQRPAHFSGTCMPSSPAGRKTSTRIKMAKIQTSVNAAW